jgi:hypothetical protein
MARHSLIEISHDYAGAISGARTGKLEHALLDYLHLPTEDNAAALARFGIRVLAGRTRLQGYEIHYGATSLKQDGG